MQRIHSPGFQKPMYSKNPVSQGAGSFLWKHWFSDPLHNLYFCLLCHAKASYRTLHFPRGGKSCLPAGSYHSGIEFNQVCSRHCLVNADGDLWSNPKRLDLRSAPPPQFPKLPSYSTEIGTRSLVSAEFSASSFKLLLYRENYVSLLFSRKPICIVFDRTILHFQIYTRDHCSCRTV